MLLNIVSSDDCLCDFSLGTVSLQPETSHSNLFYRVSGIKGHAWNLDI